jgi:hypothetical protein
MSEEANETFEQLGLLIGRENALKVFRFFEGANIYFPKNIGLSELHEQIYAELRGGANYHEAARKYGYTKSYIRKIEHKKSEELRRMRAKGVAVDCPSSAAAAKSAVAVKLKPRAVKPVIQGELFDE